ncbi:MAG: hypothetical protein U1B78_04040, partial [Dehalococcoidia bacterium]|nr:hypothetical protein [Dehalococcoidia bacterium]
MAAHRFTEADIEHWVAEGILTPDQQEAMLRDLAERPVIGRGLDLATLLYYGGGLLVLMAYGVLLGFQWEGMNEAGRIAISGASILFFGVVSRVLLRDRRFQLPGELLQVVAISVVPLFAFAVVEAAGFWPEEPGFRASLAEREEYQSDLAWARMVLAAATLVTAAAAFRWSRSPYALVAAALSLTALVIDASLQLDVAREDYEWEAPQALVVAALGASFLTAGVAVRRSPGRNYSLWLYALGLAGLSLGLGLKAFPSYAPGWGILWLVVALGVLALSLWLQERLFAAAGMAAVFAYVSKLALDVFEDANAPLGLVLIGLLILGTGILYQRYGERL